MHRAIYFAFLISTCIAFVSFIVASIYLLLDVRNIVLNMRKGIYKFNKAKLNINQSVSFIPWFISNIFIGFFIIVLILGVSITPLAMPIFW